MTNHNPIPTSWVGYYAYNPIEGVEAELPIVTFRMSWEFGWFGRFVGTVNDGPNSDMLETGKIKGYCRNKKIEFTKYMPIETIINPDGSPTRTDRRHRPIHYFGKYDADSNSMHGEWYIAPYSDYLEEFDGNSGTCLLYTSPSPRDRTRSRMPSSA